MCDCEPTCPTPRVSRRRALGLATAAAGAAALGFGQSPASSLGTPSVEVAPGLRIARRSAWGPDLPPQGAIGTEDVRFLLVHHTFSPNDVADVRALLRATYAFHTGPEKRWPDIAYHFMIAPDGSVWETRAGALHGPVVADATGGNQGFAQLVCFIGDYTSVTPTPAAQESLVRVLWWLADRYDIDTGPTATTTFVSRGSNKLPAGSASTVRTISGHRDCTLTACPGDAAYALIPRWRSLVHANRLHAAPDPDAPYRTARRLGVHLS
ncbi:MAG: N-acetylmuramoyl-L-alanine amidase [Ilumatobacteraceae bacterium]|nr:N-acetylmuramoyl-L-alanine amidase [Ilumatobacteraceae bacterium]